jgi:hypothetical protein
MVSGGDFILRYLIGAASAAAVLLCASGALAQQEIASRHEGNILVQAGGASCYDHPDVAKFFTDQIPLLAEADPGINDIAAACAVHANGDYSFVWTRGESTEATLQHATDFCNEHAATKIETKGPLHEACVVYGLATRDGTDTNALQRWVMTASQSQTITRSAWRMHRASEPVVATKGFTTPSHGDPSSYQFAPSIPDLNDAAWESAPDGEIIAFHGHNGDERSRLIGQTCRAAFDYVFFDTMVTVPAGAAIETFSIAFTGMDDGSRITIFNEAFPEGTPDMPAGMSNFVRYNEEVTMDLAQFLRPGDNRVVITQVDDCPDGNKLRRADVVLNGVSIQSSGEIFSAQADESSINMTAVQRVSSYMQSHWASLERVDVGYCGIEKGGSGGFGKRAVPTNSHGDVHIFTPDGLAYDFQAGGEFMMVASQDGSVAVQTRQTIHADDPSVSSNSAVALLVGETVLEFYADSGGQRFYIDGQAADLPTNGLELPGGARIESDGANRGGPRLIVHWPNETFSTRVNLYQGFLNVGVAGASGTYAGLIGNLDGNPKNDIHPRNGAQLVCPPAGGADIMRYGDTWRVNVDETLLRAELRETREVLVTEIGTDQRINVETAIFQVLEQNFAGMSSETTVDIDIVAAIISSMYSIDETAASAAVTNLFQQQGYMEVSQGLTVGTITNVVTTYRETRESRTIETLDIERRAIAQRVCEANGVEDQLALATCIMDVAVTQNEVFVESAQDFAVTIADLPRELRFAGSSDYNPMAEQVILTSQRVIELVGPPSVVPQLGRRPAVPANLEVAYVSGAPSITLQCLNNAEVPLTGLGIVNNMLERVDGAGQFPQNCRGYDVTAMDGDVKLSASCHTPDGVKASTISLLEVPAFARMLDTPACMVRTAMETSTQTKVTDISTQVSGNACDAAGAPDPAKLLEGEPLAGGVAVFCATHARGLTYRHEFGRTLQDALARVEASCTPAAQAMIERRGEVVIPCREVGRAERDFNFGGGQGGLERDVEVRLTTPLVEYSAVPPSVSLAMEPNPSLTASCNVGEPVALEGISAVKGSLSYAKDATGNFQTQCFDVALVRTEDDIVLQATCFTEDASDAKTSALSLLGVPALAELATTTSCQVAREPEAAVCTAEAPLGPTLPDDGLFLRFAQDGVQSDFPDRGDFVLVRSEKAGIDVQARRDLWVADSSESVFTALVMVVGKDVIEVHAAPEATMLINGAVQEAAFANASQAIELPGGGVIRSAGATGFEVEWLGTSFAMRVSVYAGSHLLPEIRPDPALHYQGLARFTSQWMLEKTQSGFTIPMAGDSTCNCEQ